MTKPHILLLEVMDRSSNVEDGAVKQQPVRDNFITLINKSIFMIYVKDASLLQLQIKSRNNSLHKRTRKLESLRPTRNMEARTKET